ncbi:MAG: hypothetical protein V3T61_07015 [Acidobacteriota bacterium]
MPSYVSCHTIACMTLQQIRYLKTVLEDQSRIQLKRLFGSQISGKLLVELEAENREDVEDIFSSNRIHFDWLIRVEFDE